MGFKEWLFLSNARIPVMIYQHSYFNIIEYDDSWYYEQVVIKMNALRFEVWSLKFEVWSLNTKYLISVVWMVEHRFRKTEDPGFNPRLRFSEDTPNNGKNW